MRKPPTKLQLRARRHNSFMGYAFMIKTQLDQMLKADSLTPEARELASRMLLDAMTLIKLLKTRVDQ